MLASAMLHSLAIRSRAGATRAALQAIVDTALDVICGSPPGRHPTRPAQAKANPRA
jgi:hypothetical protein